MRQVGGKIQERLAETWMDTGLRDLWRFSKQMPDFMHKTVYSLLEMTPKRVLVLVIIIFVAAPAALPQTAPLAANDNLYSLALRASILQMEKEWGHLGHGEEGIPTDYRRMVVQKDPIITDGIPTAFEEHSIEYLDDQQLVDRYHKLNNSFETLKIGSHSQRGHHSKSCGFHLLVEL